MKKIFLLTLAFTVLFNCSNDDDANGSEPSLVSTWDLTENLIDPGDGSGIFVAVTSDKTISFYSDGTISSNGSLCNTSVESTTGTTGIYSMAETTIDSEACFSIGLNFDITFEMDANTMIISYPCIEPCQSKYVRQ